MRKITKNAIDAFYGGYAFKRSNTQVEVFTTTNYRNSQVLSRSKKVKLWLFGNLIAVKEANGAVRITNAGWKSNTTRERLNGLRDVRISQTNWQWYLNGKEWDGGWAEIRQSRLLLENTQRANANVTEAKKIVARQLELF